MNHDAIEPMVMKLIHILIILQNALRQQRFVREVTLQYNLCNEPWYVCMYVWCVLVFIWVFMVWFYGWMCVCLLFELWLTLCIWYGETRIGGYLVEV